MTQKNIHKTKAAPPEPITKGRRSKFRVLVIEDEVEAADALSVFLEDEGYQVTTAYDGADGLKKFCRLGADLVITDIRMPGLNGTQVILSLREKRPGLPIIVITGHMGATENLPLVEGGVAVEVFTKPISLTELSRQISRICI